MMRLNTYRLMLAFNRIFLIKVDVEGAWLHVLRGVETFRQDMICEVFERYEGRLNVFFESTCRRHVLITKTEMEEMSALLWRQDVCNNCLSYAPPLDVALF
jgi:hypothetical protein